MKREEDKEIIRKAMQARIESDPELARAKEIRESILKADAHGLIQELRRAGYDVDFIDDLHEKRMDYREVIPLLVQWLPKLKNYSNKEMLVRLLATKEARSAALHPLVKEFEATENKFGAYKWAIGNTLDVIADDTALDSLLRLALDRRHGESRQMLVHGFKNLKNPRAVDVLLLLLDDEQVSIHAIFALGQLRAAKAREAISKFLNHPNAYRRKAAKSALQKIDKASSKP